MILWYFCLILNVPTYVGVYLRNGLIDGCSSKCPYIRGGVPASIDTIKELFANVPTYVGVYRLFAVTAHAIWEMSLHTWGCTAWDSDSQPQSLQMSLHTWGCTDMSLLYSYCLYKCPYIRGGVPLRFRFSTSIFANVPTYVGVYRLLSQLEKEGHQMSLHTWGCTDSVLDSVIFKTNVPTYVGVYRINCIINRLSI